MAIRNLLGVALAIALFCVTSARAQDNNALDYAVGQPAVGAPGAYNAAPEAVVGSAGGAPQMFYEQTPPTLAYNYYFPVPQTGQVPARMYLCPRPTPAHVGHTYITYQAFAPHEYLWRHRNAYYSYYPGGMTITRVTWK